MLLSPINAMLHLFFVQVTVISYNGIAEPEDNAVEDVLGELREKHAREIVFKAIGQAINKAIAVSEIIKLQKRIHGLHQDTSISSVSITDVWEPIEEGLVPLEVTRHVSMISISLSTRLPNKNSPGYPPPCTPNSQNNNKDISNLNIFIISSNQDSTQLNITMVCNSALM
ncbi:hypothetical protein KSP39_PZI008029 [Platanthera zijinensis]|uniref:DNA/RNA-binding protein Alba-like domain-containing protein n=1 Tax=Platanthera zijinensis TaxID=2320716 RepID=A0AAP0BPQ8_9ASPA